LLRFTSISAHQNRWWDTLINFQTLPTQIQTKDDEVRALAIFFFSKMSYRPFEFERFAALLRLFFAVFPLDD
jgi:hypothetical protein